MVKAENIPVKTVGKKISLCQVIAGMGFFSPFVCLALHAFIPLKSHSEGWCTGWDVVQSAAVREGNLPKLEMVFWVSKRAFLLCHEWAVAISVAYL